MAYKNIRDVMKAQSDLVTVLGRVHIQARERCRPARTSGKLTRDESRVTTQKVKVELVE